MIRLPKAPELRGNGCQGKPAGSFFPRRFGAAAMDRLQELLNTLKEQGQARGNVRGLLNVVIGRRITLADGTLVSAGVSWRVLAVLLKRVRWDPEAVRELGLEPKELPPRDRERYWFTAISLAGVDSAAATAAGERLVGALRSAGYVVGPAPHTNE
jgi:hypothetical protein